MTHDIFHKSKLSLPVKCALSSFLKVDFICAFVFLPLYIYAYVCACLRRPEESSGSLGDGVMGICKSFEMMVRV